MIVSKELPIYVRMVSDLDNCRPQKECTILPRAFNGSMDKIQ